MTGLMTNNRALQRDDHMHDFAFSRRVFVRAGLAGTGLLLLPHHAWAADLPTDDPAAGLGLDWTGSLAWDRVIDVTSIDGDGKYWDDRLNKAQSMLAGEGGGVVYFPAGTYQFADSIILQDGVVLRGATPTGATKAHDERFNPPARLEFPQYKAKFSGRGTPIDTAFKGIYLKNPAAGANVGVVNLAINHGHIHFHEADDHRCGAGRIIYGCVLRNAAVADPAVPDVTKLKQHPWQRFTARHHAAIDVKAAENILVANCRLPKSGEDNFSMNGFILKPNRGSPDRFDGVVFDYDNRPAMYICHYCVGGAGGSGNDGTPQTHPWGFRKGIVIRDNYIYNTGRMGIGFTGDGTVCANNIIRLEKDVWRPTATGLAATSGSSTNDNRAIEMRGWRWAVEHNDYVVHRNWAAQRSYLINDGEGLMHEDHCNSDLRGSRLVGNKGNSYLSIYKCGTIDGLLVEGNDISTPGGIADIYVVANRNSGSQPCRNVTIQDNTTRSNGILIAGAPASGNVVKDNRHVGGKKGYLKNEAKAKVSGNKNYEVS